MKAIYNVTGEIVDIEDMSIVTYKSSDGALVKTLIKNFTFIDAEKDYYTKLEHQYAGMAMQGILANSAFDEVSVADIAITSIKVATSLIKRLKEERK